MIVKVKWQFLLWNFFTVFWSATKIQKTIAFGCFDFLIFTYNKAHNNFIYLWYAYLRMKKCSQIDLNVLNRFRRAIAHLIDMLFIALRPFWKFGWWRHSGQFWTLLVIAWIAMVIEQQAPWLLRKPQPYLWLIT